MWYRVDEKTPPEGEIVKIITENGMETELLYEKGLWFVPDRSMYVYYTPLFWKRMGT